MNEAGSGSADYRFYFNGASDAGNEPVHEITGSAALDPDEPDILARVHQDRRDTGDGRALGVSHRETTTFQRQESTLPQESGRIPA